MITKQQRVLLYDVETTPILGWSWGMYQQNLLKVEQHSYLLSFSHKWLGDKKTQITMLPDFELYDEDPTDDYGLCADLWQLFNEADVIVAHNGVGFDDKVVRGRLIVQGFGPPSPHKTVDTLKIARKQFKLTNNKLDTIGELLNIGRKVTHGGMQLWFDCMEGKVEAWKKMGKYNKQDVDLLEEVYLRLRPWAYGHPDLRADMMVNCCHKCGSADLQKRGFTRTTRRVRQRYQCKGCGAWLQDRKSIKGIAPDIVGGT